MAALDSTLGSRLGSYGESLAVIDQDGEQSYAALDSAASAVASVLVGTGMQPGSVVATVCPAGRWWLAGTYGAWRCLLYTSPSPRDRQKSRMPSSA